MIDYLCFVIALIFGGLFLSVLFVGIGVVISGIFKRSPDRCNSDSICCSGISNSCDSNLGECNKSINSRQDYKSDSETMVIALKVIKHDLHDMLSGTEKRSIDYAIESIKIREKIEVFINERNEC